MLFPASLPDLVIASGGQASNSLRAIHTYGDAGQVSIRSPDTLPETVRIQASFDDEATWVNIEDADGNLLSLPTANQARTYYDLASYPYIRLFSTTATAAERTFKAHKLLVY